MKVFKFLYLKVNFTVPVFVIVVLAGLFLGAHKAGAVSVTDNFNRANGQLGSNWTDFASGGLAISSQEVVGTNNSNSGSGDYRTGESYSSNQYSEIQVTSTQLSGTQWIGPAVRIQNGGQSLYVGFYYWNNGSPELAIFKLVSGTYTQLGSYYSCGSLAAGTKLRLVIVGDTLAFLENGVERVAAYDSTLTGGAPGIMAYQTPMAGNWAGGDNGFQADYLNTDTNGVQYYDMISADDGNGPHVLRVLPPSNPASGVAHNFLYELPVEAEGGAMYGDPINTLMGMNAQNQYNVTIISPSFGIDPWYANHATDPNLQYESFMTDELRPWVQANLAITGNEQSWLLGFSKSGNGGMGLLLKHPSLFTLGAFWDWPADMSSYDQYAPSSSANYGTDANFQSNYRFTSGFVNSYKTPFLNTNRIWISGYHYYQTDVSDFDALLTAQGILHTTGTSTLEAHTWDGGWVPAALSALYGDSLPSVTAFSIPNTASSLTVNISVFTASDSVGVAGYMLTESTTTPTATGTGWSVSAPSSYTFSSAGTKTLYAWAKNLAGGISASTSASVTVTLPSSSGNNNSTPVVASGGGLPVQAYSPPQAPGGGFKVLINRGSPVTGNRVVTLSFVAGLDIARMAISNSPDLADAGQETFAISTSWNLCSKFNGSVTPAACPNGTHTVYVKFYTSWGQPSPVVSYSIVLQAGIINNPTAAAFSPVGKPVFTQSLKTGSYGSQVTLLQNTLKVLGFFPVNVISNGYFGPTTLSSVKQFQISRGIAKSGVPGFGLVGPKTRQILNGL